MKKVRVQYFVAELIVTKATEAHVLIYYLILQLIIIIVLFFKFI